MTTEQRSPEVVFGRAVLIAMTIGGSIGGAIGLLGFLAGPIGFVSVFFGAVVGAIPGLAFGLINGFVLLLVKAWRRRPGTVAFVSGITSLLCGISLVLLVRAPMADPDHLAGPLFAVGCAIVGALAGPRTSVRRVL